MIKINRLEEAYKILTNLCDQEPLNANHWLNKGACLRGSKYTIAAARAIKKGLSLNPNNRKLEKALGQIMIEQGDISQGLRLLEGTKERNEDLNTQDLFNYQFAASAYNLVDENELRSKARSWEKNIGDKAITNIWRDRAREDINERKICIGILSNDLADHPVGIVLAPIFKYIDKSRVELIAFSTGHTEDDINAIGRYTDNWVDISRCSSIQGARMISDLKIDVLIETGGYTAGSRLDVLIHNPAPVQLSYLGYFAPTYLKCIDGWIGDNILFKELSGENKITN